MTGLPLPPEPPSPAKTPAGTWARRARDEGGQTSTEYVGALVLVVVLASALSVLVGTSIGQAVLRGTSLGICKVIQATGLGGDCGTEVASPAPDAYEPSKCLVSSGESELSNALTLFSVRLGGDAGYVLEEKSDGKWYLTLKAAGSAGAEGVLGASGGSDGPDVGGGASASAHVAARGEGSVTYRFDSRPEAEAELAEIKEDLAATPLRAAEGYLEGSFWNPPGFIPDVVPVPLGGIVGAVREATRPKHSRPESYETSYAAGIEGAIAGTASAGPYAEGNASASHVVGVTFGRDDGGRDTQTVFYKINLSGQGSAGVSFVSGFSGTAEGEGQIALTFTRTDDGWTATNAELQHAMALSGGINFAGTVNDLRGLQQSLKEVAVSASDEVGLAGVLTANYDLTDRRTRAALANALVTVGIPALGGRPPGPAAATPLYDAFVTYDDLAFVTYDTMKTSVGGSFKVGDLIAFGAETSYTRKESELRSARYLTPEAWRDWVSCTG